MSAVNELSERDAAYIAGIVDADGSITAYVHTQGGYVYPRVIVTSGDGALVEWLRLTIGAGWVQRVKSYQPRQRPHWRYSIGEKNAVALCRIIRPYLIVKAVKAEIVLRADGSRLTIEDKEELNELNALSKGVRPTKVWHKARE